MDHHTCQSDKINWVKHDPATSKFYVSFKPKGTVYEYSDVPARHFGDVVTAKSRKAPVGNEKPGSEGSYVIHHIVGLRGQPAPYAFRKLTDQEAAAL